MNSLTSNTNVMSSWFQLFSARSQLVVVQHNPLLTKVSLGKADSQTPKIHRFLAHKSRYVQSRKIAAPWSVNHRDNH